MPKLCRESDESSDSCEDEMSEPCCTSDEEEQEDSRDYHKGWL